MAPLFNPNNNTVTRKLPYDGGSYEAPGAPQYTPKEGYGAVDGDYTFVGGTSWLNTAGGPQTPQAPQAPAPTQSPAQQQEVDLYAKYRDPKTGDVMSPEEYALSLGSKIPSQRGAGTIPQYAGDAMTNPDQSAEELAKRARGMNNERNDIATGTTDPYGIASDSGIAYSPREMAAIEKAYAGVYDPAINDVFTRLKSREDEAKKKADREASREDKIFAVNENIRQWKATTGSRSSGGGSGSGQSTADRFSQTQLNKGVTNSGINLEQFLELDPELANFYINEPTVYDDVEEGNIPASTALENILEEYTSGGMTKLEAIETITNIGLVPEVAMYFISQIPEITEEEEKGWWASLMDKWFD